MAYAREVYEVNDAAGEDEFDVTFPYIQKSHVKVSVNGTYTTDYSWITDGRIQLVTPAALSEVVVLTRETSPSERLVDYQTGSVLSEEILDTDSLQGFYLAQEAVDVKELTLSKNNADQFEAGNRRIENIANPINDTDAANKQYVISATAAQVTQASDFAVAAGLDATAANTSAGLAGTSADVALVYRNTASQHKDAALAARDLAQSYRDSAQANLAAANIPTNLIGTAGQFLQVATTENGYELVASVAAPSFFGFNLVNNDTELQMTYGRDDDFISSDYTEWTSAENITYSLVNNSLVVTL